VENCEPPSPVLYAYACPSGGVDQMPAGTFADAGTGDEDRDAPE
jgi:hypothetical protein